MKPTAVLALVLVAVAALIVAITQFAGDSTSTTIDEIGPEAVEARPDTGELDAPERDLAPTDSGAKRTAASTESVRDGMPAAPTDDPNRLLGTVVDESGTPIAEAEVRLSRVSTTGFLLAEQEYDPSQDRATVTDDEGRFQFVGVEPYDHYVLVATHDDFRRTEATEVRVGTAGEFEETVVMLPGQQLTGYVYDDGKNPVPNATLHLDGVFGPGVSAAFDDRQTTTTDEAGYFEFNNCTVGHHTLTVTAEGYGNQIIRGMQFIEGKGPNQRNIYLKIAERIAGRVVGPDGAGLGGVDILAISVSNSNRQSRNNGVSKGDGTFDIGALSEGKYTVVAKKEGFRLERSHRVDTGTGDVLLQMRRLSRVTGTVLTPDGTPPETSYEVRLRRTHANTDQTTETDVKGTFSNEDGSYEISVPADGTYLVEARAKNFAPSFSQEFRIQDGGDYSGVDVTLSEGGVIEGIILGSEGEPLAGAIVSTHNNEFMNDEFDRFLGSMNATSVKERTDAEGKFRIPGLRPDTYQIRVRAAGHVEYIQQDIPVREGVPADLGAIGLEAGGTVRGVVYTPRKETPVGIHVTLVSDVRGSESLPRTYKTKSDSGGNFVFANVAPGAYRISARDPNVGLDGDFGSMIQDPKREQARPISVSEGREVKIDIKL